MHQFVLETERLILRPLRLEDAEGEFVWLSDPEVNRYMPYSLYTNLEDVKTWLQSAIASDSYHFGFERREDSLLVGAGSIFLTEENEWEFGYNLRRDCWNKGYATEATRAMIDFARREFGAKVFVAAHAAANPASGRVMEKCGLTLDHLGEYSTFDGTETFPAKYYRMELKD